LARALVVTEPDGRSDSFDPDILVLFNEVAFVGRPLCFGLRFWFLGAFQHHGSRACVLMTQLARAPTPQEFRQPRGTRACHDSIENRFLGMEFRVRLDFVDAIRRSVPLMRKPNAQNG